MKKSKMLGTIALSAVLAMGTAVPAFAVNTPEGNNTGTTDAPVWDDKVTWEDDQATAPDGQGTAVATEADPEELEDGGSSETPVYIDVNKSKINVAVPIELRLVAETAGGPLICPSDGVYGVQNFSTNTAVYIKQVDTIYSDSNKDGSYWLLTTDADQVGAGVESANPGPKLGNLKVTISAPDAVNLASNTKVGDTYELDVATAHPTTQAKAWKIDKARMDNIGGENVVAPKMFPLNFTSDCQSSIVQDIDAANLFSQGDGGTVTPAQAFNLKYTISISRPTA